jgi:hypothetical protein
MCPSNRGNPTRPVFAAEFDRQPTPTASVQRHHREAVIDDVSGRHSKEAWFCDRIVGDLADKKARAAAVSTPRRMSR